MSREMSRPIRFTPWIRRKYPAKKPLPRGYPEIWAHRAFQFLDSSVRAERATVYYMLPQVVCASAQVRKCASARVPVCTSARVPVCACARVRVCACAC